MEVPNDVIKRIKKERENECEEGSKAAVKYAEESSLWLIEKAKDLDLDDERVRVALNDIGYYESSSEWKNCFVKTLSEILEKSK